MQTQKKHLSHAAVAVILIHKKHRYCSKFKFEKMLSYEKKENFNVVLTVRASHLVKHPGEVALPGGLMEEVDVDFTNTALRETREEIGVSSKCLYYLGDGKQTISKYGVTVYPKVFLATSIIEYDINEEVDTVFEVPLSLFLQKPHKITHAVVNGVPIDIPFYDYLPSQEVAEPIVIWGLTARILRDVLECIV